MHAQRMQVREPPRLPGEHPRGLPEQRADCVEAGRAIRERQSAVGVGDEARGEPQGDGAHAV